MYVYVHPTIILHVLVHYVRTLLIQLLPTHTITPATHTQAYSNPKGEEV